MYYIPGIFSIILLPVLGIWYMNTHGYFTKLSAHAFYNMDFLEMKKVNKEYLENSGKISEFEKRIYKQVTLNNDINAENTFKYINQFVNEVIQTKDTINALKVHFGKNSTYKEFIHLLDIFAKRDAELYILDHNTIYFAGRDWDPKAEKLKIDFDDLVIFTCGSGYYNEVNEQTFNIRKELNNIKSYFSQNKIIYSAYFLFFTFAVVLFIIQYKKR